MEEKQAALQEVADKIITGKLWPDLCQTATRLVLGEGNPEADILFIGEAPGKQEDLTGRPFVGAAGKFLNEMLSGIGLTRDEVFITNIVKYRPPANRDPSQNEIETGKAILREQVDIIQPKLIVLLGRHAMSVFLPALKISQAHGQAIQEHGRTYLPLYHPAAALYNRGIRQTLIEDFNTIPHILKKL